MSFTPVFFWFRPYDEVYISTCRISVKWAGLHRSAELVRCLAIALSF